MTTLGFLNPKAGSGQSRLIFNLGWVLADAGFRVGLVDFDPQAGLTELAGPARDAEGSIYGALAPIIEATGDVGAPALVELESDLWLVRGHISASTFDDALATAWSPSPEPLAQALVRGIASVIKSVTEQRELDIVLCDLGSSLGPLCHAAAMTVDAIVVPLTPRIDEDAALRSLAGILRRWRDAPPFIARSEPYRTLGFVIVRPSGAIEMQLDQLTAAYHRELSGDLLGTIKEFSSLASIARLVHKPEIELTMADGATGSLFSAVSDLRRQYEALATRIARVSGLLDEDVLSERLGRILYSELEDDLPAKLDELSAHTILDNVEVIDVDSLDIRPGGLRIVGSATVSVTLQWGGGEVRDGVDMPDHFPLRFDLELDRSHESVAVVHRIDVDTSSFYE